MNSNQLARRILLVDDEPGIGIALMAYLKGKGFVDWTVDQAYTMEDGIARAPGAFVILQDLTIPPTWTPETTKELIPAMRKHAPVIVITGWGESSAESMGRSVSDLISIWGAEQVFLKDSDFHWKHVLAAAMAAQGRRQYEAKPAADAAALAKPLNTA